MLTTRRIEGGELLVLLFWEEGERVRLWRGLLLRWSSSSSSSYSSSSLDEPAVTSLTTPMGFPVLAWTTFHPRTVAGSAGRSLERSLEE